MLVVRDLPVVSHEGTKQAPVLGLMVPVEADRLFLFLSHRIVQRFDRRLGGRGFRGEWRGLGRGVKRQTQQSKAALAAPWKNCRRLTPIGLGESMIDPHMEHREGETVPG